MEKTVKKFTKDKNGNLIIEETKVAADGTKTIKVLKLGVEEKEV